MTPEVRGVVNVYRGHLARFRALQDIPGSNWTDVMVAEAIAPHRANAEQALYRRGFTRDQVAGLLTEPGPRPAKTVSEYMNQVIRGGRT